MTMKPNEPQKQALQRLDEYRLEGKAKSLVVLPSGVGKTQQLLIPSKQNPKLYCI